MYVMYKYILIFGSRKKYQDQLRLACFSEMVWYRSIVIVPLVRLRMVWVEGWGGVVWVGKSAIAGEKDWMKK